MERQIKFRGKRADNGEWVYGDLIHGAGYKYGNSYILPNKQWLPTDCDPLDGYKVIPSTVGQFTGLFDCNGKEIYEGDIVRYYDDIEDELVSSHVIYHKESCSFCVAPTKLCGDYIGITAYWQFEVIGNIHDNQPTEV